MYENSPREMLKMFGLDWSIYGDLILGGEAAMWSEQVTNKFYQPFYNGQNPSTAHPNSRQPYTRKFQKPESPILVFLKPNYCK